MSSSHVRSAVAKLERSSSSSISLSSHIDRYQDKIGNGSVRSRSTATTVDLDESRTSVTFESDLRRPPKDPFCSDDSWSCMTECSFTNESIHLDAVYVTCGTDAQKYDEDVFKELRKTSTQTSMGPSQKLVGFSSQIMGLKAFFEQKSGESAAPREGSTRGDFYSRAYRSCSDVQSEQGLRAECNTRYTLPSTSCVMNHASVTSPTLTAPRPMTGTNASKEGDKRSVPLNETWLRRSDSAREVSTPIEEMVTSLLPSYESQLNELRKRGRKQPIKLF
jgi:hypothetical protein